MLATVKSFAARNERRFTAFAFLLGFLWDNLTLQRVDRLFDNLVLASYLVIALAAICLINAHGAGLRRAAAGGSGLAKAGWLQGRLALKGVSVFQFLLPFAFGGLFSGFLIFYSRSGSLLTSAPFLLVLALLFFGNEFFRRHYERFVFQMSVFFVALFSYSALIVPVLFRRIGDVIFLASGLAALLLFWVVLRVLRRIARDEVAKSHRVLWPVVGMIYITFHFLYFNNMIPPIPLSLEEIGVYHGVERTESGGYLLRFERAPWYAFGQATGRIFHRVGDEPAYAWSSVYAPTRLETDIVHRWSYVDDAKGEWTTANTVRFPISGGREGGFRGYSVKENITPGKWRVDVETVRGQIIGRFSFDVVPVSSLPLLEEAIR